MKKSLFIIAVLLGLSGCSNLPTMQYCDRVSYVREGNLIHLNAECRAPVGASGMPGVMP